MRADEGPRKGRPAQHLCVASPVNGERQRNSRAGAPWLGLLFGPFLPQLAVEDVGAVPAAKWEEVVRLQRLRHGQRAVRTRRGPGCFAEKDAPACSRAREWAAPMQRWSSTPRWPHPRGRCDPWWRLHAAQEWAVWLCRSPSLLLRRLRRRLTRCNGVSCRHTGRHGQEEASECLQCVVALEPSLASSEGLTPRQERRELVWSD